MLIKCAMIPNSNENKRQDTTKSNETGNQLQPELNVYLFSKNFITKSKEPQLKAKLNKIKSISTDKILDPSFLRKIINYESPQLGKKQNTNKFCLIFYN